MTSEGENRHTSERRKLEDILEALEEMPALKAHLREQYELACAGRNNGSHPSFETWLVERVQTTYRYL